MMRRRRSHTISVDVDLAEFDDDDIRKECEERGLEYGGIDFGDLRRALHMKDAWAAINVIERALPSEFGGLADQICGSRHVRNAA